MKRPILVLSLLLAAGCAIHKVETSKSIYNSAIQAEEAGKDVEAILYWKKLVEATSRQIDSGQYPASNYFMRAAAQMELGLWNEAFADLKNIDAASLSEAEYWMYPLYLVMQGDYYAASGMPSVASNFYQAVLKKSSYKTTSVYLLALERQVNNTIKSIQQKAAGAPDPEKYKDREYKALAADVLKYVEEFPHSAVPHYLLADLLLKTGAADDALEQVMAALDLGLPTQDLRKSAEFLLATIASGPGVNAQLKSTLLRKSVQWWSSGDSGSILRAGENQAAWLREQDPSFPESAADGTVRWLAVIAQDRLRVLLWEAVP